MHSGCSPQAQTAAVIRRQREAGARGCHPAGAPGGRLLLFLLILELRYLSESMGWAEAETGTGAEVAHVQKDQN